MKVNFLVITANVGSLFEDLKGIEETWLNEVFNLVTEHDPHFIALHCQEVGGKDYKTSLDPIKRFYKKLSCSKALRDFPVVRAFVDGDVDQVDQYTALASFYFVHKTIKEAELYDFKSESYTNVAGKDLYLHNIHQQPLVRKEKFRQSLAPDSKRSRKGYCRARWKIFNKVIEFVNVHLFHDDSNLISFKSSPSPYTAFRKQALKYVLKRLREDNPVESIPYLIFGDFNFRLDVKALIQSLAPSCYQQDVTSEDNKEEVVRICFREEKLNGTAGNHIKEENNKAVIELEKKFFKVNQPSLFQPKAAFDRLRQFDLELPALDEELKEFDVQFPPTYPFSENTSACDYMNTRCPSWCDRVLVSKHCWDWMHSQESSKAIGYDTIGKSVCVGDHKPVYLSFSADIDSGGTGLSSSRGRPFSFFESCTLV